VHAEAHGSVTLQPSQLLDSAPNEPSIVDACSSSKEATQSPMIISNNAIVT
jgi:hypothetical protein